MKTYPLSSYIEKLIRPSLLLLKLFVNHNVISIFYHSNNNNFVIYGIAMI